MKPTRTITLHAKPNTVALSELSGAAMAAGNDQKYVRVIMRGRVLRWSTIAGDDGSHWISEGKPTAEQLRVLPRVSES